jgi:hypothetical protein
VPLDENFEELVERLGKLAGTFVSSTGRAQRANRQSAREAVGSDPLSSAAVYCQTWPAQQAMFVTRVCTGCLPEGVERHQFVRFHHGVTCLEVVVTI